jgi:hypothetical protein
MPNFDGTGPYGNGRIGRGMGPCGRGDTMYGYRRGKGYYQGTPRYRRHFMDYLYPIGVGIGQMLGLTKDTLRERKTMLEEELNIINKKLNETGE